MELTVLTIRDHSIIGYIMGRIDDWGHAATIDALTDRIQ